MSVLLSLNVPSLNFPIVGPPTPRSRLTFLALLSLASFSNMMPFSFASFRRDASLWLALAVIPRRCDRGIFACVNKDDLAPSECIRRSKALWRWVWVRVEPEDLLRRCDSFKSRCKSRSRFRLTASAILSSVDCSSCFGFLTDMESSKTGGFALLPANNQYILLSIHLATYHECFYMLFLTTRVCRLHLLPILDYFNRRN